MRLVHSSFIVDAWGAWLLGVEGYLAVTSGTAYQSSPDVINPVTFLQREILWTLFLCLNSAYALRQNGTPEEIDHLQNLRRII
jgi:hypothetical protein